VSFLLKEQQDIFFTDEQCSGGIERKKRYMLYVRDAEQD